MNRILNTLPPPEGYSSWLDFAVESFGTRGPSLDSTSFEGGKPSLEMVRQAARTELRELRAAAVAGYSAASDPLAPLTAALIGQVMGLDERSVHAKVSAGQLFSIVRDGGSQGFPAFQAWPGVAGEPLERTLAALVRPGKKGTTSGASVYGFLTSPTDLLGDLAPLEVLLGRQLGPRQIAAVSRALLASSQMERLHLVLMTARAIAGSENA